MFARLSFCFSFGLFAVLLSTHPASAHHGWGGNSTEEFELTGVVDKGVSLSGPHATMKIRAEGQVWDITLAPPPSTERAGLKEGIIPVGATVTIHGHRNLDPKRFEIKGERVLWNGKTFNVYPDQNRALPGGGLYEFMAWLEGSALGHAMREHGVWTYGVINLVHILGVTSLFGSVLVLDLRLLGAWRTVPLAAISRPVVPVATIGFTIATLSGVCLLATRATEYVGNPFLYIKFPAIALGLLNVIVLSFLPAWKEHRTRELNSGEQFQLRVIGGVSLFSWLTAISAGRMVGYW